MCALVPQSMNYYEPPVKIPNWIKSLEEELDCLLLVILRDGRKLVGYLRTFDQYGNMVLEDTLEKIVFDNKWYANLPQGSMIIRGENIVLFGAVDEDREETIGLTQLPLADVLYMINEQKAQQLSSIANTDSDPTSSPIPNHTTTDDNTEKPTIITLPTSDENQHSSTHNDLSSENSHNLPKDQQTSNRPPIIDPHSAKGQPELSTHNYKTCEGTSNNLKTLNSKNFNNTKPVRHNSRRRSNQHNFNLSYISGLDIYDE